MLVGYAGIVLSASYSQNRIYLRSMLVSATVEEQKKTISLLLKDFEAHSSDWLWETDENLKIVRASERFAQAAGRTQAELAGMSLLEPFGSERADAHPAIGVIVNSMERHLNFTEIEVPVDAERRGALVVVDRHGGNQRRAASSSAITASAPTSRLKRRPTSASAFSRIMTR